MQAVVVVVVCLVVGVDARTTHTTLSHGPKREARRRWIEWSPRQVGVERAERHDSTPGQDYDFVCLERIIAVRVGVAGIVG